MKGDDIDVDVGDDVKSERRRGKERGRVETGFLDGEEGRYGRWKIGEGSAPRIAERLAGRHQFEPARG